MGPGFGAPPPLYDIEGYLDRAPEGTLVLEEVEIGKDDRRRTLLVTFYSRPGRGRDRSGLFRDLGLFDPDFHLQGRPADVAEILNAPAGSFLNGTFKHSRRGVHTLLISDVEIEPPDAARPGARKHSSLPR